MLLCFRDNDAIWQCFVFTLSVTYSVSLSTQGTWWDLENNWTWICEIARHFLMAFYYIFKEYVTGNVTLSHHSVKEIDVCIWIFDLVWKLHSTECLNLKTLLPNIQAKIVPVLIWHILLGRDIEGISVMCLQQDWCFEVILSYDLMFIHMWLSIYRKFLCLVK